MQLHQQQRRSWFVSAHVRRARAAAAVAAAQDTVPSARHPTSRVDGTAWSDTTTATSATSTVIAPAHRHAGRRHHNTARFSSRFSSRWPAAGGGSDAGYSSSALGSSTVVPVRGGYGSGSGSGNGEGEELGSLHLSHLAATLARSRRGPQQSAHHLACPTLRSACS